MTAITGTVTTFGVGVSGDTSRYGNGIGKGQDSTNTGMSYHPVTYYSDTPEIDADAMRQRIDTWLNARAITVETVAREETGVLPVAMGGDFEEYWHSGGNRVAKAGMRAGLFQLTSL